MLTLFNPTNNVAISGTGMQVSGPLTVQEWEEMGPRLGEAHKITAFVIGDWLCYSQTHFDFTNPELPGCEKSDAEKLTPRSRPSAELIARAVKITGLDAKTLVSFAMICRQIPSNQRNEKVCVEAHRIVARLPQAEQVHWLKLAEDCSSRKLRIYVQAGRVLTDEEMAKTRDESISTHNLGIVQLMRWWADNDWTKLSTEQKAVVRQDMERLRPIISAVFEGELL